MRVAFYESAQDNIPRSEDVSWPDLVRMLTTHRRSHANGAPCPGRGCTDKNGKAWSPVHITDRRRNENVLAVTVAVFDLDHLTKERVDALRIRDYSWILHSTHSSKPGDICLRLIMPLSRPVLPREWPRVRSAAVQSMDLPADPATKDLARLYYLPDTPACLTPLAASGEGRTLDVDVLLSTPIKSTQPRATPVSGVAPKDLPGLAAFLMRNVRRSNSALIGRVLRGEPLAPIGGQDAALQAVMSTCAFCLPDSTSEEAIISMLRPSLEATDWGEGTEHLVREAIRKLRRARLRRKTSLG